MTRYTVVLEKTRTGFSAYVPALPGCVATGRSREIVFDRIQEAIAVHIEGLQEDGEAVPEDTAVDVRSVSIPRRVAAG